MSRIIGVSHPLPESLINRFFKEGKDVFIKRATLYKKLEPGMKFVFYRSAKDTGYVGEAKIKSIHLSSNYDNLYDIYNDRIYMTKNELEAYIKLNKYKSKKKVKHRPYKRLWIALELEDIRQYTKTIKPDKFVLVNGRYLTVEE